MPIVVLTGKNSYIISQTLEQLTRDFVAKQKPAEVLRLDGNEIEFDTLNRALFEQGLFSTKVLVILRQLASNKVLQQKLETVFTSIPEDVHLVIIDQKLDKRTQFYKKLKAVANVKDYPELDEQALALWIQAEFTQKGGEIAAAEARFLVSRAGTDQWQLSHEIDKLINENQPVQKADIERVVDQQMSESIFSLLDLAFSKKQDQAMRTYRNLILQRIDPYYILSMIAWQLHILLVVAHSGGASVDQIANQAKLSPFVVKKAQAVMRLTNKAELEQMSSFVVDADFQAKTGAASDVEALVEYLLVKLAS